MDWKFIVTLVFVVLAALLWWVRSRGTAPTPPDDARRDSYLRDKFAAQEREYRTSQRLIAFGATGVTVLGVVFLALSLFYVQPVGTAKIPVAFGAPGTPTSTTGIHVKAPYAKIVTWDLFSRDLLFAGAPDGAPQYSNGEINGAQITASVARGTRVDYDLQATYQIDPDKVLDLYSRYRDQDRFTRQVVTPQILSVARDVPTGYDPIAFRGDKRSEAETALGERLEERFADYGITFTVAPTLQNISYPQNVEESINAVEAAQQNKAKAQAELEAAEVSAQQRVVEAQATADSNDILTKSLSPQVLQQRYIDALKEGTVYVVPADGAAPLIQVPGGSK